VCSSMMTVSRRRGQCLGGRLRHAACIVHDR
jgi:hypothetical protein